MGSVIVSRTNHQSDICKSVWRDIVIFFQEMWDDHMKFLLQFFECVYLKNQSRDLAVPYTKPAGFNVNRNPEDEFTHAVRSVW